MSSSELESHGQALYSLLLKPVVNNSPDWKYASEIIRQLANCVMCYSQHLKDQLHVSFSNQASNCPARPIGEHASIEHRSSGVTIKLKYSLLDAANKEALTESPILFDESVHLEQPFSNATQKYRYLEEL